MTEDKVKIYARTFYEHKFKNMPILGEDFKKELMKNTGFTSWDIQKNISYSQNYLNYILLIKI